jgi:hypothetical protein
MSSPVSVTCSYGNGDKPTTPYSHVLILSRAIAEKKGFALLDETFKIKHQFKTPRLPWPSNGHLLRPGIYIQGDFPVAGYPAQIFYVKAVNPRGDDTGVWVSLDLEYYEAIE